MQMFPGLETRTKISAARLGPLGHPPTARKEAPPGSVFNHPQQLVTASTRIPGDASSVKTAAEIPCVEQANHRCNMMTPGLKKEVFTNGSELLALIVHW
jgi:hypothetical protein